MFCHLINFQYICSKKEIYGKIYYARPHCLEKQKG